MKCLFTLTVTTFLSAQSFASDARNIILECQSMTGWEVTAVSVTGGEATVSSYSMIAQHTAIVLGGPFRGLETFGGGDFVGVKTADGSFSLIGGSLEYRSNFNGEMVHVDNVKCTNAK